MIIPRETRRVQANPAPLPTAQDSEGEIVGKAVQQLGDASARFVGQINKERDELDTFQTNMAAQRFHGDQSRRQVEYDNAPEGDGRDHAARRLAEYDQAATAFIGTLPNNERSRRAAQQHVGQWREQFGVRSYTAQRNQMDTYREHDVHQFAVTNIVPTITNEESSVSAALQTLDANLSGSNLPEARRERIRTKAVGLMVERFVEQGGSDARARADRIIESYRQQPGNEPGPVPGIVDFRDRTGDAAAIRYNNPGGQYPGDVATRWGSTRTEIIGGGHKIAVFPDALSGAAAQLDLLSSRYTGVTLENAIRRWSGGNSSKEYVDGVVGRTGLAAGTVLTPEMIRNPEVAVPLARAMAQHEAGSEYPLTDSQWRQAHEMFVGGPGTVPRGQQAPLRSDGLFVQGLIHSLDKIDARAAKIRVEEENTQFVLDALAGRVPFNGHDDVHRKRLDDMFKKSRIADKLFAGDEATLVHAVAVAHALNYVPQPVSDALRGLINSPDEDKRALGYRFSAAIVARNPHALAATPGGPDLRRQIQEYTGLVTDANLSPQEATRRIAEMQNPDWAKLEAERKKLADDPRSGVISLTESDLRSHFDPNWLPFNNPNMPGASGNALLMSDYRTRVREHYIRHGDMELAKKLATGELKRSWGISSITGPDTLTRYPPENFYPEFPAGGGRAYLQQDLRQSIAAALGIDVSKVDLSRATLVGDERTQRDVGNPQPGQAPRPTYAIRYRDGDGPPLQLPGRWAPDIERAAINAEAAMNAERATVNLRRSTGAADRIGGPASRPPPGAAEIIDWLQRQGRQGGELPPARVFPLGGRP